MRRHFCSPLSTVHLNHLWRVNGQHPVGVDCHTEQPRVGLEEGGKGKRRGGEKRGGRGERERGREREREGGRERERERWKKRVGGVGRREGKEGEERKRRGKKLESKEEYKLRGRMKVCVCVYGMEWR